MIEYQVMLKRFPGSTLPDVFIYRDENREKAIREMWKYDKANGFSVMDKDGRHTIANIVLIEKKPIAGAPILSETSFIELFDNNGKRRQNQ